MSAGKAALTESGDITVEGIKEACELVSKNIAELSFDNKRVALEAPNIKIWLDGENITLEGAIPLTNSAITSTPPEPSYLI